MILARSHRWWGKRLWDQERVPSRLRTRHAYRFEGTLAELLVQGAERNGCGHFLLKGCLCFGVHANTCHDESRLSSLEFTCRGCAYVCVCVSLQTLHTTCDTRGIDVGADASGMDSGISLLFALRVPML